MSIIIVNEFTMEKAHEAAINLAAALQGIDHLVCRIGQDVTGEENDEILTPGVMQASAFINCAKVVAESLSGELAGLLQWVKDENISVVHEKRVQQMKAA